MFIPLSIHPNIRLSGHPSVSKSILFSWPNLPVIKKRLTESSDTYNEPKNSKRHLELITIKIIQKYSIIITNMKSHI